MLQEMKKMSKGKITNVRGDATSPQTTAPNEVVIIPHCCNNKGGWGKGFVLALSKKWGEPEQVYRRFCINNKGFPILGKVCYSKINDHLVIANMIGQDGTVSADNPKPVKYWALANCMAEVVGYIDMIKNQTNNPVVIHTPKFGSDLAGGNWEFILELIDEIWCRVGIDVVVYEFESDSNKWGPLTEIDILIQKEGVLKSDLQKLEDRRRYFVNIYCFSPEEQEQRKKDNNETIAFMETYGSSKKDDDFFGEEDS